MAPLILNLGYSWGEASGSSFGRYAAVPARHHCVQFEQLQIRVCTRQVEVRGGIALHIGRSRVRFPMGSFRPPCDPGVDSASNRTEYQGYFLGGIIGRCPGLTTLSIVYKFWEPQPPAAPRACPDLYRASFAFYWIS